MSLDGDAARAVGLSALLRGRAPGQPLLLDGGMGSALIARGLEQGQPPERWNLERPQVVQEVHAGYLAAGSELIQTNTFGGNEVVLGNHGLADQLEEINLAGVRLAREAADRAFAHDGQPRLVAGNMGPSGLLLQPVGPADPVVLEEAFARQAAVLVEGGVDAISIETMIDLREALCALRGALRVTQQVTVCFTFEQKQRGFFTLTGDRLELVVQRLAEAGAVAVGANCSVGSDALLEATPLLVRASPVPVIIKPNAGLPDVTAAGPVYHQDPEDFARDVADAARQGAAAVGGCCGADERFIAATKRLLSC